MPKAGAKHEYLFNEPASEAAQIAMQCNAMAPHAVPQQNQNKSILMTWPSTLSEHGHPWDISKGIFKFKRAKLVFVAVRLKEQRKV